MNDLNNLKILVSGSYSAFQDGFDACGVYMASGIFPSNTFETPWYFGSAKSMKKRITSDHIPELNNNIHDNKPMQNYYNKHGKECLIWFFLEASSIEERINIEQKYFDKYKPFVSNFKGFNIVENAGKPMGGPLSEETKEKISKTLKGKYVGKNSPNYGRNHSEETKQKLSKINKGKKWSKESIEKRTLSQSKEYCFVDKDGRIIKGKNIKEFCKKNKLCPQNIYRVLSGELKHTKGWRLYDKENLCCHKYKYTSKKFSLISPNGKIIHGENIKKFADKNGLNKDCLGALINGKKETYRGWRRLDEKIEDKTKKFKFISPDGKLFEFPKLSKFCKENNLSYNSMINIKTGISKSYNGWTLYKEPETKQ